jgi:broad specificity phosphatase PhoE
LRSLILVKHSLPEIVPVVPAHQWHLSEKGRLQCIALAKRLTCHLPGCIVSSKEPKAVETAQLVADHVGQTVQIIEGLHEHDRSNVEWTSEERFEAQVAAFFRHPDRLVMGTETASEARKRFTQAVTSVLQEHPNDTVVIFAHGTVITLFVAQAVGLEAFRLWKQLGLPSFVVMSLPEVELVSVVESLEAGHCEL